MQLVQFPGTGAACQGFQLTHCHFAQLFQALPLWETLFQQEGIDGLQIGHDQQLLNGGVVPHIAFAFGIFGPPLLGGFAEQGHIQDIRFIGIDKALLILGKLRRNQILFDGIGVNPVVRACQDSLHVPSQGQPVTFVPFEPLVVLDDIELEFRGQPGGKLKGNVLVGIGPATIPARLGDQADGVGLLDPFLGRHDKGIGTGIVFKLVEFDQFKNDAGSNAFVMSPQKWVKETNAIGLVSKSGRYGGGTYAHKDIAFEFASWLSPEFKLYIIKDYQRLKGDESHRLALGWNVKRILASTNYRIHTDAIKENLIPPELPKYQQGFVYADEADVLNVALFGKTAKQWRAENPKRKGNMRDYATIEQLLVMTNLEAVNALLLEQGLPQRERLEQLRKMAVRQLETLTGSAGARKLNELQDQLQLPET